MLYSKTRPIRTSTVGKLNFNASQIMFSHNLYTLLSVCYFMTNIVYRLYEDNQSLYL